MTMMSTTFLSLFWHEAPVSQSTKKKRGEKKPLPHTQRIDSTRAPAARIQAVTQNSIVTIFTYLRMGPSSFLRWCSTKSLVEGPRRYAGTHIHQLYANQNDPSLHCS